MLDMVAGKQSAEGGWRAESASKAWGAFDFGQKEQPSPWMTFLAVRAVRRAEEPVAQSPKNRPGRGRRHNGVGLGCPSSARSRSHTFVALGDDSHIAGQH